MQQEAQSGFKLHVFENGRVFTDTYEFFWLPRCRWISAPLKFLLRIEKLLRLNKTYMFHEVHIGCVLTAAFCCKPSLTIVAFLAGKLLYEVSAFSPSCPLLQIVTPPVLPLQDFAGPLK